MGKRRKLRGKKLLIVSGAIAGAAMFGCGDDDGSVMDSAVANLIPPMDTGTPDTTTGDTSTTDSAVDGATDATTDAPTDAPTDATTDAPADASGDTA